MSTLNERINAVVAELENEPDGTLRLLQLSVSALNRLLVRSGVVTEEQLQQALLSEHLEQPKGKSVINPPFTPQELAKVDDPEGRAGWSYSPYRATLQLHGSFFALVTPNGKDALSPEDTTKLLRALNGSA